MSKKDKSVDIKFASVDELLSEGFPENSLAEYTVFETGEEFIASLDENPDNSYTRVRAERNFDQSARGDEYTVDLTESYWSDALRSGNISVTGHWVDGLHNEELI